MQGRRHTLDRLEQRHVALVAAAYGRIPADVALLWHTAPPRMPSAAPRDASVMGAEDQVP